MDNISTFFNNRSVNLYSSSPADITVAFGDWCLTPIRCLFDGNYVYIFNNQNDKDKALTVRHKKEYGNDYDIPQRNFLRVVASIVVLVPGAIIGSIFKGLGYLSSSIRERHRLTIQHFTPIDRMIGAPGARLSFAEIKEELQEAWEKNHLGRPTHNLIVYAKEGTTINENPMYGIHWNPQKIILVGARLAHQSDKSGLGRFDDALARKPGWASRLVRTAADSDMTADNSARITQWKVKSVEDAIRDIPPRLSLFLSKRYHRVYIV